MRNNRIPWYQELEKKRSSKLLVYSTSNRPGMETSIAPDILPKFTEHLDIIAKADKISLLLITNGGDTLTAWSLVNLIRSYCEEFEVIIPANCFSSGTLISLGANNLLMTKQATLGPIDPSTSGPLNPVVPGTNQRVPVSVEFVNAYIEMAKNEFAIHDEKCMTQIFLKLSELIHPLSLGQVYRSRQQIQMLAKKLISWQHIDSDKEQNIISFLCSESGSHDYAIRRKEAKESLGLNVETPDMDTYTLIKNIYRDISSDLEFDTPFNPEVSLGTNTSSSFSCRRCIIESTDGGIDTVFSEGELTKKIIPTPTGNRTQIESRITFEGWRHEN